VFRSIAQSQAFPARVHYIDFITPAMLAVSTVMSGTNSGVAIAADAASGVFDRFRTLPLPRSAVYVARALTDAALTAIRVLILLGVAWLLLGFHFRSGPLGLAAVVAVLLPLSLAMSSLFLLVGARLGHPEVVQFAGMMLMMPLMFLSSAFAPLATMPAWLHAAATANPVSHAIDAARSICLGQPDAGAVLAAVASAAGLAVMTALATRRVAP
jgi:ABC-2 type transport system permease protein